MEMDDWLGSMCDKACPKPCLKGRVCQERIRIVQILCQQAGDATGLYLAGEALNAARSYVVAIYNFELLSPIWAVQDEDAVEQFRVADKRRKMAHDALCSGIAAVNRHLFQRFVGQIPVGGICAGVAENMLRGGRRHGFAEWARIFVCSEFHMKANKEKVPL